MRQVPSGLSIDADFLAYDIADHPTMDDDPVI